MECVQVLEEKEEVNFLKISDVGQTEGKTIPS